MRRPASSQVASKGRRPPPARVAPPDKQERPSPTPDRWIWDAGHRHAAARAGVSPSAHKRTASIRIRHPGRFVAIGHQTNPDLKEMVEMNDVDTSEWRSFNRTKVPDVFPVRSRRSSTDRRPADGTGCRPHGRRALSRSCRMSAGPRPWSAEGVRLPPRRSAAIRDNRGAPQSGAPHPRHLGYDARS